MGILPYLVLITLPRALVVLDASLAKRLNRPHTHDVFVGAVEQPLTRPVPDKVFIIRSAADPSFCLQPCTCESVAWLAGCWLHASLSVGEVRPEGKTKQQR